MANKFDCFDVHSVRRSAGFLNLSK